MGEAESDDGNIPAGLRVPQSFVDMPRWWRSGTDWLAALPRIARRQCERWHLNIAGEPVHGSNALVLPVVRAGEMLALRLTPPGPDVGDQVAALRFWDGRGTVRLIDADLETGALLLERLAMDGSLTDLHVDEAIGVLGRMMRRLAVPAPAHVRCTAAVVRDRSAQLPAQWQRLGGPFDAALLRQAMDAAARLSSTGSDLAVNADLHSAQVLRGTREPWLTVDPVLLRGDIAYDLARVLWTRIDEMSDDTAIVRHFETAVREARLERDHSRDWVVFRTVDYWLWGLDVGLTEDPRRCRRLIAAFTA